MIRIQLFAISNKFQRICPYKKVLDFLLDVRFLKEIFAFASWFGLVWITLHSLSRQVLHNFCMFVMHSKFLLFVENLAVFCYQYR